MEEVVWKLLELGPGVQMANMDIERAYRMVPVHPQDRYLLGMQWKGQVYVDAALPFGLEHFLGVCSTSVPQSKNQITI